MSVEKIIEKIQNDAAEERERIIAEAEEERKRILDDAAKRAEKEYDLISAKGEQEIKTAAGRIISQAKMDARRMVREEKERTLSLCFEKTHNNLLSLRETPHYRNVLRQLINDGIRELQADDIYIIPSEKDREIISTLIPEISMAEQNLSVGHECAISTGGIILRSHSRYATLDNTFDARMARMHRELVIYATKELFESG